MDALQVTVEPGSPIRIRLHGAIDEQTNLDCLIASITGPTSIDCSGIVRINSIGVHTWVRYFAPQTEIHPVEITRLSYPFVMHAHWVRNLFGNAVVSSCMAPYFCRTCKTNPVYEVTRDELLVSVGNPPEKSCDQCKGQLEFDELHSYFAFLLPSHMQTSSR